MRVAERIKEESHTVHNLKPDTSYIFVVRARNAFGISEPSAPSDSIKIQGGGCGLCLCCLFISVSFGWLVVCVSIYVPIYFLFFYFYVLIVLAFGELCAPSDSIKTQG